MDRHRRRSAHRRARQPAGATRSGDCRAWHRASIDRKPNRGGRIFVRPIGSGDTPRSFEYHASQKAYTHRNCKIRLDSGARARVGSCHERSKGKYRVLDRPLGRSVDRSHGRALRAGWSIVSLKILTVCLASVRCSMRAERSSLHRLASPKAVPAGKAVHLRFLDHAAAHPHKVAVTCGDQSLTYGKVASWSAQVAGKLRRVGVGPESRVGLFLGRSVEAVIGLTAILMAGGAYVPLDPTWPEKRIRFILADAGCKAVVTGLADRLSVEGVTEIVVEEEDGSAEIPLGGTDIDSLAYIIYTSGSSGAPKGCMVTHRNVARLFDCLKDELGFGPDDAWTLFPLDRLRFLGLGDMGSAIGRRTAGSRSRRGRWVASSFTPFFAKSG